MWLFKFQNGMWKFYIWNLMTLWLHWCCCRCLVLNRVLIAALAKRAFRSCALAKNWILEIQSVFLLLTVTLSGILGLFKASCRSILGAGDNCTLEEFFFVLSVKSRFGATLLVFLMIFKLRWPVEFRATALALEFAVFVVAAHMVLKMTFCDELLIADLTLVVALPEMTLKVDV